jgi:hypothetical protein
MKTLILFLLSAVFVMAQPNLNAMSSDVVLGGPVDVVENCTGVLDQFTTDIVHFEGYQLILNEAQLTITDEVEFGGSFLGYCDSRLVFDGEVTIKNTDPVDPGGDIFTTSLPDVPNLYTVENITITLPNVIPGEDSNIGWYELYDLIEQEKERLSVPEYDYSNQTYSHDRTLYLYNQLGQLLAEGPTISTERLPSGMYVIKDNYKYTKKILK